MLISERIMNGTTQQKSAAHRNIWRICEGTILVVAAAGFLIFGSVAINNGAVLWGGGFVVVGLVAIVASGFYLWRGGRVGIQIVGDDLLIQHYFSKSRVPLETIRRFYRSVDATVFETSNGNLTIDDSYFADPQLRDSLLQTLRERLTVPR
ncbi:MAG: hypothetical protein AB1813_08090 [Verrucomicrobiota bacterium]|jgi:hypothetical protein